MPHNDKDSIKELTKRLNVGDLYTEDKIYITEIGTVFMERCFDFSDTELLFEDFIKETSSKISKEEASIKYDECTNKFYLILPYKWYWYCESGPIAVEINMNKEYMNNYALGKYNNITSSFNELCLQTKAVKEKKELLKKEAEMKKEVINKAKTSHETLTPAEAKIYIDYLDEQRRTNAEIIKGNVKSIIKYSMGPPSVVGVGVGVYTIAKTYPVTIGLIGGIGCFIAAIGISAMIEGEWIPLEKTIYGIGNNYKKMKELLESNKKINAIESKIRETQKKDIDKIVIVDNYSVEEINEGSETLNVKDSIIKSLDKTVNRINALNLNDKNAFLIKAKVILFEYIERYKKIVNQDDEIIDIEADNLEKLKIETLVKISILEMDINDAINKETKVSEVLDDGKLLAEKINGFVDYDLDVQRVHEQSIKKVKVKKLIKEERKSRNEDLLELRAK